MRITMVKKRLKNGEPCQKCLQSEELLRSRGYWARIDDVVWAEESDPDSAGMKLSRKHGVETAPFFLVENSQESNSGDVQVYKSTLRLIRDHMPKAGAAGAVAPEVGGQNALSDQDVARLQDDFESKAPQDIVKWALARYGRRCAIAFSGAEDVALIEMAIQSGHEFSVFCLDTGRLHPETYRFIEKVRGHYGIEIDMRSPDAEPLQVFVRRKGLFSFLEDGHKECCGVRKIAPLRAALTEYDAWISGQRKDQSPATRSSVPTIQFDSAFAGRGDSLVKLNPLSNFSSQQTWGFIREHGVPFNELHTRGFKSIGCEPCTRPVHPGQHEREGRWWWEADTQKECGLHSLPPPGPVPS